MVFKIVLTVLVILSVSLTGVTAQNYEVEIVAENLEIPWAIAFAPDGRIFVTERVGNLRVIENEILKVEPVKSFNVFNETNKDGGLLGIALDPNFEKNHFLYLYYTYEDSGDLFNKVIRFTEHNNKLSEEKTLLDKITAGPSHDGGRIKFGPDDKLYITTGDSGPNVNSMDLNSLAGKILRINSDGTIPDDNPFPNSPVYSLGHRNPQGLDWDPVTMNLVATEHGRYGQDEVNIIEPGENYGWPRIRGDESNPKYQSPFYHTGNETWAPSGASFYTSKNIPEWENMFFIATLRGNHLRMLDLDLENHQILSSESLLSEFGRLRDASMGLDGNLYILTSNKDGRGAILGSPRGIESGDDKILRIVPNIIPQLQHFLSPLKQSEQGIPSKDVICSEGLEIVLKKSNELPSCVKPSSVLKLIERGWAIQI